MCQHKNFEFELREIVTTIGGYKDREWFYHSDDNSFGRVQESLKIKCLDCGFFKVYKATKIPKYIKELYETWLEECVYKRI